MAFPFAAPVGRVGKAEKKRKARDKDSSPGSWQEYFDACEDVAVPAVGGSFRVYRKGSEGPLIFLLHGGGHSSLVWALFAEELVLRCKVRMVAIDFRAHGGSSTVADEDLSCATLCGDVLAVIKQLYPEPDVPTVLVGHSMGGAIAIHLAASREVPKLAALVVIDVVEGSALEALAFMRRFLATRPQVFSSQQKAIEWSVRSGQLRSLEAARISLPDQLKAVTTESTPSAAVRPHALLEEDEEDEERGADQAAGAQEAEKREQETATDTAATASKCAVTQYTWRVDLERTEPHWHGWFEGISAKFIAAPVAKLLLLAGVDRLDKDLTIAQMQGKFQMQVFSNSGHSIHEDAPERVAEAIASFLTRMRIAASR